MSREAVQDIPKACMREKAEGGSGQQNNLHRLTAHPLAQQLPIDLEWNLFSYKFGFFV